jgi:hypothetical protein
MSDSHTGFDPHGFSAGSLGLAFGGSALLATIALEASANIRRARASRNTNEWYSAFTAQQELTGRALAAGADLKKQLAAAEKRATEAEARARAAEEARFAMVTLIKQRRPAA